MTKTKYIERGLRCKYYKGLPKIPDKGCFIRLICHGGGMWDPCVSFEMCAAASPPRVTRLKLVPAETLTAQVETERDGVKVQNHAWIANGTEKVYDVLDSEVKHISEIYKRLPRLQKRLIQHALSNLKKKLQADNPKRGYWRRIGNETMNNVKKL